MADIDVTAHQFRYLVSWTHQGQTGHYHHVCAEWRTPQQTIEVMGAIKGVFELDDVPCIMSVFPMGEVTP